MKIQRQTNNTTVTNKRQTTANSNTSFAALLSTPELSASTINEVEEQTTKQQHEQREQPLDKVLSELESIMLNLEENSLDHRRAQRAINSLRDALHEIPQAFPLTEQDREEAKTLLAVESSRIKELCKQEDNH